MKQTQILAIAIENVTMIVNGYEGPWINTENLSEDEMDKLEGMIEHEMSRHNNRS